MAFALGKEAVLVVLVDLIDALLSLRQKLCFIVGNDCVPHGNGQTGNGGIVESRCLNGIKDGLNVCHRVTIAAIIDQHANIGFHHLVVNKRVILGQALTVKDDATNRCLKTLRMLGYVQVLKLATTTHNTEDRTATLVMRVRIGRAYTNDNLRLNILIGICVNGEKRIVKACKRQRLVLLAGLFRSKEVDTENHILRRYGKHLTGCGATQVIGRKHEYASLGLCLSGKGHVNRHLVAVEVSVKRSAYQRVKVNCLTFNKNRLKRLDGQAVKRRCTVQEYQTILNDLVKDVPNRRKTTVNGALRTLDVFNLVQLNQAAHYKRLKELKRHGRRKTALVQLQVRVNNDDGTAGIIDALTQKILTEAALFALESLGKRLQRTASSAGYRTATTTVVKECIDGFLKHALLVVDDDCRSIQIKQTLQAVIAVDNTTIQIVEIRCRKATAVKLNHRTKIRRDNGDDVKNHVSGIVSTLKEGINNLKTLDGLLALLLLRILVGDNGAELLGLFVQINATDKLTDCLGAHAALKVNAVVALKLGEEPFIGDELTSLKLHELFVCLATKNLLFLVLFFQIGNTGTNFILRERLEVIKLLAGRLSLLFETLNLVIALGIKLFKIRCQLFAQIFGVSLSSLGIDTRDDI